VIDGRFEGSLTADAHGYDVGPTPWYLEIYDVSTGGAVAICGSGTTCSTSVSQGSPTTHWYRAYIANYSSSNPPSGIQATSNYVSVTWLSVSLGANTRWVPPGAGVTLTVYANTDVGPTPWYLEIFDQSTGGAVAICASGSSCSVSVSQSYATTHSYVGYASGYGTSNPPPSVQATSNSVAVTWLAVSLGVSTTVLVPGGTTTLTAYANTDVGPSPYYIEIFDSTTGTRVAVCGSGSSCSTNVTQSSSTIRNYVAYIALSGTTNPPPSVQVTSNTVLVTWLGVSLSANPTILAPGGTTTLTASASQDVGPTPYYIEIFDHTTFALLATCATGITCSTSVSQSSGTIHNFIAYISTYGTSDPPSNTRATSNVATVTWLAVSLKTSAAVVGSGATVTLTATANANVSGTPYWVEIFDQTTNGYLNACGTGSGSSTVCTATSPSYTADSNNWRTTNYFIAYVTSQFSTSYPPLGIQATSNLVATTWSWETCDNEGGIWMMVSYPQPTGIGNQGEIQNVDRTLAGCGPYTTVAWATVGISPTDSLGTWMETGWTLSYNLAGTHYRWWFTEWGINHTVVGRDSDSFNSICTLGGYARWDVEGTAPDEWSGLVDCEDGKGWHVLHSYTGTGFTSGIGWSEAGRHGGTGTSLEDYHRNLQYEPSVGTWSNWPGMVCQLDAASNWYPAPQSANSWKSQQGTPTC
jgi:hypothetical protein